MRLVINSTFKPFTYDEMVKPLAQYKEVFDTVQQGYDDLIVQTEAWKDIANQENSPEAYAMYKQYSDRLNALSESFSKEGLKIGTRRSLSKMKRDYAKDIVPIKVAYDRRKELADEQRKSMAANPTLRYQRIANEMSLDDFIRDPSIDYGKSYSGALLTQQVSQAVAAYQKAMTDVSKLRSLGLPFQYERYIQHGATPAQVMAAISNDAKQGKSEAVNFLIGVRDQVLDSSGVASWASPATMNEFIAFANQGLYNAIGETNIQNLTDEFSMRDTLNARQHAREEASRIAAERRAAIQAQMKNGNFPINIDELESPNMAGEKGKESGNKALRFFGLSKDGKSYKFDNSWEGINFTEDGRNIWITRNGNIHIWEGNGHLMSKQRFIDLNSVGLNGNEELNSKRLGKWYDQNVTPMLKELGLKGTPHMDTVWNRANRFISGTGGIKMSGVRLNFGNSPDILQSIVATTRTGDETGIKEIKSFTSEGKIEYGNKVPVDEFLDDDGNLVSKATPIFHAVPNSNTEGIIMSYNGKMYAIPKKYLGSLGDEVYNIDIPTLQEAYAVKQQALQELGEYNYYNSEIGQQIENAIDNAGAAYVRAASNSFASTYKAPDYSLTKKKD